MKVLRISSITIAIVLLMLGCLRTVSAAQGAYTQPGIQIIGPGCTTAFYIDPLCKPCGVGMKSSGQYPLTQNPPAFGTPAYYTMGNMPDADPNDPNVCTTAQWETKWGWTTPVTASDNSAMVKFIQQDVNFSNTSRIFYISMTGNDATAVMNDPSHPYATMAAIESGSDGQPGIDDNQGGVVVVEGGDWGAPGNPSIYFSPCQFNGGNPCWQLSGSVGHPLLVMSFPGEVVDLENTSESNGDIDASGSMRPWKNSCCLVIDGLEFWDPVFGRGAAINIANYSDITVENSEFAGWDKIIFSSHTVNALIKNNVFHDMRNHAIYFATAKPLSQGPGDFNFTLDQARWLAGTSVGASYHGQIIGNVMYGNGDAGYEPIHINTYIDYPVVEGNIISYSGGTGIGLETGVYHAFIADNVIFDNGRACITLYLYDASVPNLPATLRWNTIENNTCYVGMPTDYIRGTRPAGGILQNDGSSASGTYIKDTTIKNNIIVTHDIGGTQTGQMPLTFEASSYPETDFIQGNLFWSTGPTTDRLMVIKSGASPNDGAGVYNFAQFQAFNANFSGNQYADPQFASASPNYTLTPGAFNFSVAASSPAANIGANLSDLLTPPTPPLLPPPMVLPSPPGNVAVN